MQGPKVFINETYITTVAHHKISFDYPDFQVKRGDTVLVLAFNRHVVYGRSEDAKQEGYFPMSCVAPSEIEKTLMPKLKNENATWELTVGNIAGSHQKHFPPIKIFGKDYCRDELDDLEDELLGEDAPELIHLSDASPTDYDTLTDDPDTDLDFVPTPGTKSGAVAINQHTIEKYKKLLKNQAREIEKLKRHLDQADKNLKEYTGGAELMKQVDDLKYHKDQIQREYTEIKRLVKQKSDVALSLEDQVALLKSENTGLKMQVSEHQIKVRKTVTAESEFSVQVKLEQDRRAKLQQELDIAHEQLSSKIEELSIEKLGRANAESLAKKLQVEIKGHQEKNALWNNLEFAQVGIGGDLHDFSTSAAKEAALAMGTKSLNDFSEDKNSNHSCTHKHNQLRVKTMSKFVFKIQI